MLTSSLLVPDAPEWHDDPGYSTEAATALTQAYRRIKRASDQSDAYLWACGDVAPWLDRSVSERQRVHLYFVFTLGHAADGAYTSALFWLDRALDMATNLGDVADCLELLLLRSAYHRAISKCRDAISDLQQCLNLAQDWEESGGPRDLSFRFQVLAVLAQFEFYAGHFRRAEHRIRQARLLIPSLPERRDLEAATLTLVQAHLDRTRGQPDLALLPAIAVSEVYSRLAPLVSQDRIHVFVAATALDVAATFKDGPPAVNRAPFLLLARRHLAHAEQITREAHDHPGKALAQVMRARYNLLSGLTGDRVGALERAIRTARHLEDEALLAEGLTALGDEFAARGERESALDCYRQVLDALNGSQIPALETFARRALLRDQESHV